MNGNPTCIIILPIMLALLTGHAVSLAAQPSNDEQRSRIGLSAGMGVSYVNVADVADYVNALVQPAQRLSDFKTAVEFFGSVAVPVSRDWDLKLEYAYMLGTYNVGNQFFNGEFSFSAHMPTVIGQYVLVEEKTYNVKLGAGAGYHFGALTESFGTVKDKLTGHGIGTIIDLEANTAFGESFFGYIGGDARWDFIGDLTAPTRTNAAGAVPTLHFFSVGARFGFTYYF